MSVPAHLRPRGRPVPADISPRTPARSTCPRGHLGPGPPREIANTTAIQRLAFGAHHGCAVDERGAAWCWGSPKPGRGHSPYDFGRYAERENGLPPVVGVSAGPAHTCAWSAAGELWCWGSNHRGQLGDDTTEHRDTPTRITIAGPAVAVTAGDQFTCPLRVAGLE